MDKTQNENGTETSKNQIVHPEATSDGENPTMQGKVMDYSSSSSSSSSSNPLELDAMENDLVANSFNKLEQSPISSIPDLLSSPEISTTTPQWSMMSDTPRGGSETPNFSQHDFFAQEWASINASPKQSPPVQVMGRPPGYDPNRIPSSVFSTKPTTQTDQWSVASNESLFSIHMGNSSFSRDHSILFGKSGELNRTDEWGNSPYMVNDSKTGELNSLPTVIETEGEHGGRTHSIDEDNVFETKNRGSPKRSATSEDVERKTVTTQVGAIAPVTVSGEGARNSASTSRLSNESGNSASSFAFPVLGGEGGSPMVTEKPGSNGEKQAQTQAATDQKKGEGEPQSPLDRPKAITGGNKWFPCFSCCPLAINYSDKQNRLKR